MDVILYKVGRNINRAYRTCASFGVRRLVLVDCSGEVRGNLYSASGRVQIEHRASLDAADVESTVALETWGDVPLSEVCWDGVRGIVIGGESVGLPRSFGWLLTCRVDNARSPSLTVEAALTVALYAWRIRASEQR